MTISKFGFGLAIILASHTAFADKETMVDRCSGEVAFTPTYDGKPTAHGTVVLKRDPKTNTSPWVTFSQKINGDGHVRWWCHSTIGNVFDPGTWRVDVEGDKVTSCLVAAAGTLAGTGGDAAEACKKVIKIGSSAFQGWTPERSRCDDHSHKFRARLGPDRKLETQCLGK